MNLGLIAAVIGAAAAVAGVGVALWQGWLVIYRKPPEPPSARPQPEDPPGGLSSWADLGVSAAVQVDRLPAAVRGRDHLLRALDRQLRAGGLAVLAGTGGMGKSTVARELVRRMPRMPGGRRQRLVWEVSAADQSTFSAGLLTVARDLGASEADLRVIAAWSPAGPDRLWELLASAPRGWLLIIDNADELALLACPVVPGSADRPSVTDGRGWPRVSGQGLVLVTSRQREVAFWPARATVHVVKALTDSEAGEILLDLAPKAGTRAQARALGGRLGGLPLVLRLAGRYLSSGYVRDASFEAYRRALDASPEAITLINPDPDDPELAERTLVMLTWELSLDALRKHGLPQARPLLRLLSCYAPAVPIPLSLLNAELLAPVLRGAAGATDDSETTGGRVDQILRGLDRLGLIEATDLPGQEAERTVQKPADRERVLGHKRALVVHPAIADTNRVYLLEPADPGPLLVRQTAVSLLAAVLDTLTDDQPTQWPTFRGLAPHLQALIANSASRLDGDHLDVLIRVTGHVATAYGQMRSPEFGIDLVTSALEHAARRAGDPTPAILIVRQQLAHLLSPVGRGAEAEAIYREILQVQLRVWPEDDPANLAIRHNLAASVGAQGPERWHEAETAFRDLIASEQRVLGENDPITLDSRRELATLLGRQGRWREAETALRDLLKYGQQAPGADDKTTLATRYNLAQAVRHQEGREAEGEAAFGSLLADAQELLGEDHFITVATREFDKGSLLSISLLSTPALRRRAAGELLDKGVTLGKEGRFADAAAAYRQLVDRFTGDGEPALRKLVAMALFNLAIDLSSLGRLEDALQAAEQAVGAYGELATTGPQASAADLGTARQLLAQIKNKHAMALFDEGGKLGREGRLEASAAAYRKLVDRFAGDNEPALRELVADALFETGVTLGQQRRPEDAAAVYGQLVDRLAGDDAPAHRKLVGTALISQAAALSELKHSAEALEAVEQAVDVYRKLAETEPAAFEADLVTARQLLAQFKNDEAIALFDQGIRLRREGHPEDAAAAYGQLVSRFAGDSQPALRQLVARALVEQGVTLGDLGRLEEAVAVHARLVGQFGGDDAAGLRELVATALVNLAIDFSGLGRREDALKAAEQAVGSYAELAEADPGAFQGRLDAARQVLAHSRSEAARALFHEGTTLAEQGHPEAAAAAYRQLAARFDGGDEPALRELVGTGLFNLAATLATQGYSQDAEVVYRRLVSEFGTDDAPAARHLVATALIGLAQIENSR